jgi:hypothetical protein
LLEPPVQTGMKADPKLFSSAGPNQTGANLKLVDSHFIGDVYELGCHLGEPQIFFISMF